MEKIESPRRAARESAARSGSPLVAKVRGLVDTHPRAVLGGVAATAFALASACALLVGVAVGGAQPAMRAQVSAPEEAPVERALPATPPEARAVRTCSVSSLAQDPRLGKLTGSVVDALSGEVLYSRDGSDAVAQASVAKVLTATAALTTLGPDRRLSTKVFEGSQPGSIVLVGGGDPTLTRVTSGESFYQGAPKLSDLAGETVAAYALAHPGEAITRVYLDSSYWDPNDNWLPSWPEDNRALGFQSRVTALQVDGDRDDPLERISPRSEDPVTRAGQAFAQALADATGTAPPAIELGVATSDDQLAEVQSQPVSTLVGQMLESSDGALAESLARATSIEMGTGGASASAGQAVTAALAEMGMDVAGVAIADGSGLSADSVIPPLFVANLMSKVREGNNDLEFIYNALSVAGVSGGLVDRFTGANEVARGKVWAKNGNIPSTYSIAGLIEASDGLLLSFSFVATGDGLGDGALEALDSLTTAVFSCGERLAPL